MTSALVPFTFNDTKLFTVTVDGKHWINIKNVCFIYWINKQQILSGAKALKTCTQK